MVFTCQWTCQWSAVGINTGMVSSHRDRHCRRTIMRYSMGMRGGRALEIQRIQHSQVGGD